MNVTGCQPRLRHAHYPQLLAISTAVAWSMLVPSVALAVQSGYDYDCTDFDSRDDAQAFYETSGGPLYDPYNLDDDEDGDACEEWERDFERTTSGERGINGKDGIDTDCADFDGQDEANIYFVEDGGTRKKNVDHLDPNHNGIACEEGEPG